MIQLSSENLLFHFSRNTSDKHFPRKRLFALAAQERTNFTISNLFCGINFRMLEMLRVCGKCNSLKHHTNDDSTKPHTDSLVTQKPITALETFKWNLSAEIKVENDMFLCPKRNSE